MNESVHFSSLCTELPGLASCWQPRAGNTLEQVRLSRGASHQTVACPALPACWCQRCSGKLGPSLNGWPSRGETGALLSGRWSRVSHHSMGCPADHSPVGVSEVVSCRASSACSPSHLGCGHRADSPAASLAPWVYPAGVGHQLHHGQSAQSWAPLATNQIFPWSRWPQDYLQGHSESHIVGSFNFAGR